tara:strand:- start:95 stop:334 length:240 start_codon:yes stop_codon:yes gene_type:complete
MFNLERDILRDINESAENLSESAVFDLKQRIEEIKGLVDAMEDVVDNSDILASYTVRERLHTLTSKATLELEELQTEVE